MFRKRERQQRKPRVYRIPVETYLIGLALALALAVAFSLLSGPREIGYRLSHYAVSISSAKKRLWLSNS